MFTLDDPICPTHLVPLVVTELNPYPYCPICRQLVMDLHLEIPPNIELGRE